MYKMKLNLVKTLDKKRKNNYFEFNQKKYLFYSFKMQKNLSSTSAINLNY